MRNGRNTRFERVITSKYLESLWRKGIPCLVWFCVSPSALKGIEGALCGIETTMVLVPSVESFTGTVPLQRWNRLVYCPWLLEWCYSYPYHTCMPDYNRLGKYFSLNCKLHEARNLCDPRISSPKPVDSTSLGWEAAATPLGSLKKGG